MVYEKDDWLPKKPVTDISDTNINPDNIDEVQINIKMQEDLANTSSRLLDVYNIVCSFKENKHLNNKQVRQTLILLKTMDNELFETYQTIITDELSHKRWKDKWLHN